MSDAIVNTIAAAFGKSEVGGLSGAERVEVRRLLLDVLLGPIPQPLHCLEEWTYSHNGDLSRFDDETLQRERGRVRLRLLIEGDDTDPWWYERLRAIEEEIGRRGEGRSGRRGR
jgi:hypothetical protein